MQGVELLEGWRVQRRRANVNDVASIGFADLPRANGTTRRRTNIAGAVNRVARGTQLSRYV